MRFLAEDIMSDRLINLKPSMSCEEALAVFRDHHIGGAPVVDDRGVLIGVLSVYDLLSAEHFIEDGYFAATHLEEKLGDNGFHIESQLGLVSDYMTTQVYTAYPNTPLQTVAQMMLDYRIHRLIIVRPQEQIPVGIISTFDLLKVVAGDTHSRDPIRGSAPAVKGV